jgi:hypothetical protein
MRSSCSCGRTTRTTSMQPWLDSRSAACAAAAGTSRSCCLLPISSTSLMHSSAVLRAWEGGLEEGGGGGPVERAGGWRAFWRSGSKGWLCRHSLAAGMIR